MDGEEPLRPGVLASDMAARDRSTNAARGQILVAAGGDGPLPVKTVEEGHARLFGFDQRLDEDGTARRSPAVPRQRRDDPRQGLAEGCRLAHRKREELAGVRS